MKFRKHYDLQGKHAFLGASTNHWLNYSEDKIVTSYHNSKKKELGTKLHSFASEAIKLGIKLANYKKALNMFVNDAIGFQMESEVVLYASDYAFGTADAISFKDKLLRIHDLKTGTTPVTMVQLDVYAALFCIEYQIDPYEITILQRIYQGSDVIEQEGDPDNIKDIMRKISDFSALLLQTELNMEV